eukprot:229800-Hanusia_phi.AAC.1
MKKHIIFVSDNDIAQLSEEAWSKAFPGSKVKPDGGYMKFAHDATTGKYFLRVLKTSVKKPGVTSRKIKGKIFPGPKSNLRFVDFHAAKQGNYKGSKHEQKPSSPVQAPASSAAQSALPAPPATICPVLDMRAILQDPLVR